MRDNGDEKVPNPATLRNFFRTPQRSPQRGEIFFTSPHRSPQPEKILFF
jgi:hypothetical protein